MIWLQNYDPLQSPWLSTLVAVLPVVVLLGLLGWARWQAHWAAGAGLLTAALAAVLIFQMPPVAAASAIIAGAGYGLFPIGWIVVMAIFLYALTVETGQFEIVKRSVASLSPDRRIQALLIAFCFGAFIEGAAGFGTPVAISAALLIGAGFRPLPAAGLALIANTAPVAFGALGTPITALATASGIDEFKLSQMAGRQLPFFSLLVPVWMVWVMAGWRGVRGVGPALFVCGASFASVQFYASNFLGSRLVDVAAGLTSLIGLSLFLRFWQPRTIWRFDEERDSDAGNASASDADPDAAEMLGPPPEIVYTESRGAIVSAWMPWAILSVCVFVWGLQDVKLGLDRLMSWTVAVPGLHERVARNVPIVSAPRPEPALFKFNPLSATGTGLFVAAVLSAIWMRVSPRRFIRTLFRTFIRMKFPLLTIALMLALAYLTRYSGLDATLGLAFTRTGVLYPFFAALLGWLGVALTGSDTSANALFGSLQRITAERLGLNPVLICTANSTGGVMGKMIDAQSIVVSAVATNQSGNEGEILRYVFWHSLALATLMGLLTLAQAYWLTGMVPHP
ncbi:MAG TPA: lactate permease LctP family transporter [Pirellulales bacterium]|jgi:lactate permease|nr:lactate permease LctP family transporter [Pirellulales bacterium]